jgi:hypothetical protein
VSGGLKIKIMNKNLFIAGKEMVKELLAQCTDKQQETFKMAFGRKNGKRSVEDALKMSIDEVVEELTESNLNSAIDVCERTVKLNLSKVNG